ncbi:GxxExxY protein [Ekhidna sp.]|uniref:GxxExxY protein n=1 Tax=Ekhidna sp. TaxID=2608089 RepID=UPI003CCBDD01
MTKNFLFRNFCHGNPDKAKLSSALWANYAYCIIWVKMDQGFRADLIIENKVLIEIKSVENILPVHQKQVLTYLKLTKLKLGLLINFNESLIKNGIQRIVNGL